MDLPSLRRTQLVYHIAIVWRKGDFGADLGQSGFRPAKCGSGRAYRDRRREGRRWAKGCATVTIPAQRQRARCALSQYGRQWRERSRLSRPPARGAPACKRMRNGCDPRTAATRKMRVVPVRPPNAGAAALVATAGERGAGGKTDAQRLQSPHSGNAQDARFPVRARQARPLWLAWTLALPLRRGRSVPYRHAGGRWMKRSPRFPYGMVSGSWHCAGRSRGMSR